MKTSKNKLKTDWRGKKVLVMGLGLHGGGAAAAKFWARRHALVTVTDLKKKEELAKPLTELEKTPNIKFVLGEHRREDFTSTDLIVKGPGVKPDSEYLKAAREKNIPVINDIAIFFAEFPGLIVAVTGTRGKSTTAFLLSEFLRGKFPKVILAGNIRKPVLGFLDEASSEDIAVLELSSFQLQDLTDSNMDFTGRPEIAVLTNIYEDHLNWHGNMTRYEAAKKSVFSFQTKENVLFVNPDDKRAVELSSSANSQVFFPRLSGDLRDTVEENLGAYYAPAVALAAAAAEYIGVEEKKLKNILRDFKGLEGRQELMSEKNGIIFVNDTTSTIPEASVVALNRFAKKLRPKNKIILIAGGEDKGLNYEKMTETIKEKATVLILLPGTATEKIKALLSPREQEALKTQEAASMQEAVAKAKKEARAGDYVLLSPGAASFGIFKNEFDRGDKFKMEVKLISK